MFFNIALAALVACILIVPWTLRNYLVSHDFVPVATGDGTVLLGSYNDQVLAYKSQMGWINPAGVNPQVFKRLPIPTCQPACEVAYENLERNTAIQWIRSHLKTIPRMMVYHLEGFFTPYMNEADLPLARFPNLLSSKIVLDMSKTFPIAIFLLAAFGLIATLRRYWRDLSFTYLMILATVGEILVSFFCYSDW